MVCFFSEHCVEERFAGRFLAAAVGFDCDKDSVNFCQLFGIIAPQCPTPVGFAIHVKNAQIQRLPLVFFPTTPGLERAGVLEAWLAIEVKGVKKKRFALCIEDAAEGHPRAAMAINIENVRNVKPSRHHQFADVAVGGKVLLIVYKPALLAAVRGGEYLDSGFKRRGLKKRFVAFGTEGRKLRLDSLVGLFSIPKLAAQSVAL